MMAQLGRALVIASLVFAKALATPLEPLSLSASQVRLTAGRSVPLPLTETSRALIKKVADLSSECGACERYSISVGRQADGQGLFLAAPRTMTPGQYSVRVTFSDQNGGRYAAEVGVLLEAPPPVPQTDRRPVVLVNGFDIGTVTTGECTLSENSTVTFGRLEQFLVTDGAPVVFFDNCTFGAPPLEVLGQELGNTISMLKHPDGSAVEEVDVVAFSMGALIARSYLAGKESAPGVFSPPANPKVGKLVLVAAEHFGAPLANVVQVGEQLPALRPGSRFLWDLNTWHQSLDDLREIDALAIAGTGGLLGRSDGVAPLAGASLSSSVFFGQEVERTRIIPACHNRAAFPLCATAEVIMEVDSEQHPSARIIRSFLGATEEWRFIGETTLENEVLMTHGGVNFALRDASDTPGTDLSSVLAKDVNNVLPDVVLEPGPAEIFLADLIPSGTYIFRVERPGRSLEFPAEVPAGGSTSILGKLGPKILRVLPSGGLVGTLSLAADSLVSLFGEELAASVEAAGPTLPLPRELAGTTVTANGQPLGLLYVGPSQINAHFPAGLSGLVRMTVSNTDGLHTVNVLLDKAVPAVFALDGSGQGPAAALHALTGSIVSEENPVRVGDFVSLFATGLGPLVEQGDFLVAEIEPTVAVGGVPARVQFGGTAVGFVGLNQVNIELLPGTPTGVAVPVVVRSGERVSNEVTLAIQ